MFYVLCFLFNMFDVILFKDDDCKKDPHANETRQDRHSSVATSQRCCGTLSSRECVSNGLRTTFPPRSGRREDCRTLVGEGQNLVLDCSTLSFLPARKM